MNKKAIIFTIDALVALSIFIAVAIAIYSIFTPSNVSGTQDSLVYVTSENFMQSSDANETFSQAFKLLQQGQTAQATTLLNTLLSTFPYDATIRMSILNTSGALVSNISVNDKTYDTSVIVRKFLVLSEKGSQISNPDMHIQIIGVKSVYPNDTVAYQMPFTTQFYWSTSDENPPSELIFTITNGAMPAGWSLSPSNYYFGGPLPPGMWTECLQQSPCWDAHCAGNGNFCWFASFPFNLNVPSNALIGEYTFGIKGNGTDAGLPFNKNSVTWINIIQYGFVEMEVGTS